MVNNSFFKANLLTDVKEIYFLFKFLLEFENDPPQSFAKSGVFK